MTKTKIKSRKALKEILNSLNGEKKVIGFTNGCFDIIHYGHIQYIEKAKKLVDILIVALNSDRSVKGLKGDKRPIFNLQHRMKIVAALEAVDFVTYFNEDTPAKIINCLKPDIIFKGADYKKSEIVGKDIVESYGGKVEQINYLKGYSVTSIVDKIIKVHKKF